jgi:hypothetical protein
MVMKYVPIEFYVGLMISGVTMIGSLIWIKRDKLIRL